MLPGFDLLSVPLPGGGWFLLEADSTELNPDHSSCTVSGNGLPAGWKGRQYEGPNPVSPIQIMTGRHPRVRLLETTTYHWELETGEMFPPGLDVATRLEEKRRQRWSVSRKNGILRGGTFCVINHLGGSSLGFTIPEATKSWFEIPLEFVSGKFDFDTEYRRLTEDIAAFCKQLLLDWDTPTSLQFTADPVERSRMMLEQFLFLRAFLGTGGLARIVDAVRSNPHTVLMRDSAWRPVCAVRSPDFLSDPLRMTRSWTKNAAGRNVPSEAVDIRKNDSVDTPPNRFLRFALEQFRGICANVVADRKRINLEDSPTAIEARSFIAELDGILASGFFRDVGILRRLPLANQTLQKREGYREILQAWFMTGAAASLDWEGNEGCYGGETRDVATLYEYWLFIQLHGLLSNLPEIIPVKGGKTTGEDFIEEADGGIRINLIKGRKSCCKFLYTPLSGVPLRIDLYYERQFHKATDGAKSGSYSRNFKPDFTMTLFPATYRDEAAAYQDGRVSHVHFDAKYRAEKIMEIIGDESGDPDPTAANYKREDLLKMHTYNDAVRHTAGSYVLYPGVGIDDVQLSKYHEIAPGVGAFVMKPGRPECLGVLEKFLEDSLRHQADQFSQFRYISHAGHMTYDQKPKTVKDATDKLYSIARPEAPCVLLWLRSGDAGVFKENGFAYCHAVPKTRDAKLDLEVSTEIGSEFIPFGGGRRSPKMSLGWRAIIKKARYLSSEVLRGYIEERGLSDQLQPGSSDYYLLYEFENVSEFVKTDVTHLHQKYRKGSDYMAVTFPFKELLTDTVH